MAPASLQKSTQVYAHHQIPLECDIYDATDYPPDTPVFLFFHSGGLVSGARSAVPPWLAQCCFLRKWPLISASYRLLPQVAGAGLLDDARAAYDFARSFRGHDRPVIAGGASAGFFLASLIAHHLTPKPIALLSITGIPTFHHSFFNSSVLLTPEPIPDEEVPRYLVEPVTIGRRPPSMESVFFPERLQADGSKNSQFTAPTEFPPPGNDQDIGRGMLYDHWLYNGEFLARVEDVDPGFANLTANKSELQKWPRTVFIQGDQDFDVSTKVCEDTARQLGQRAVLCLASGQGHLFERSCFLEDTLDGMDAVRRAVGELDQIVGL
ncbi:Alpha/Beta hydrolase fold [Naviculisporaceae sp. PSN 640]